MSYVVLISPDTLLNSFRVINTRCMIILILIIVFYFSNIYILQYNIIFTSTCVKNVYKKTASKVIGNLDKYYVNIVKSIKTKIKISNMHEF